MTEINVQLATITGTQAVITGAGGLGFEAATALANAGASVILASRSKARGEEALARIRSAVPRAQVEFELLDLASLSSVRDFVERTRAHGKAIDILINNAGIMSPPQRRTTVQGFELQFGVNYLGHFALTAGLLPLLRKASQPRVVSITSLAQHYAKLDLNELQSEHRYNPGKAYCQSKLAQAMFTLELQRQSDRHGWGLTSVAAHPGYAATNLFQAEQGRKSLLHFISSKFILPLVGQSAKDGALPILYAATSPDVVGGSLYGPTSFMELKGAPGRCEFAKAALDEDLASTLWKHSEELIGSDFEIDYRLGRLDSQEPAT